MATCLLHMSGRERRADWGRQMCPAPRGKCSRNNGENAKTQLQLGKNCHALQKAIPTMPQKQRPVSDNYKG
ncbi:hypothetical protein RRG08_048295 [Elysia crispata]|uniref:Uncharacterized protein n=1 Tax=Elysia crispata TaxID=231223 RepID=A0AAE0ZT57_9GAST|nr:hypothetical protein RRG08_048295 [Elysia crispata]